MDLTLLIDLVDVRGCTISNFTGIREMMKLSFLGISKILGLDTFFCTRMFQNWQFCQPPFPIKQLGIWDSLIPMKFLTTKPLQDQFCSENDRGNKSNRVVNGRNDTQNSSSCEWLIVWYDSIPEFIQFNIPLHTKCSLNWQFIHFEVDALQLFGRF